MNQGIFSIYDSKAAAHLPPFFLMNSDMAKRTFGDCIADPKHAFNAHPHDYTLFFHGQFDNNSGKFQLIPMESLGNGVEFIKSTLSQNLNLLKELEEIPNDSKPKAVAK